MVFLSFWVFLVFENQNTLKVQIYVFYVFWGIGLLGFGINFALKQYDY